MRLSLFLASILLTSSAALAQRSAPDYLVTQAGDTLRGEVELQRYESVRLHRKGLPVATFTAADMRSCGNAKGPYLVSQAVGVKGQRRLLAPVVEGRTRLYMAEDADKKPRFFVQTADSAYAVEVPPVTMRVTLLRLLPGCPTLDFAYSDIERRYRYTPVGMARLVQAYDACLHPEQPSRVVKSPGGISTQLGVKAGLHRARFTYPSSVATGTQAASLGYHAGLMMHVTAKTRFSVQSELIYVRLRNLHQPVEVPNGFAFYKTTRRSDIQFSQLQIPFLLRYTLGKSSVRPFLNAGVNLGYNFGNRSEHIYQNSHQSESTRIPMSLPWTANIGFAGGSGVMIQVVGFPVFNVELRLLHNSAATNDQTWARQRVARLDVGVLF